MIISGSTVLVTLEDVEDIAGPLQISDGKASLRPDQVDLYYGATYFFAYTYHKKRIDRSIVSLLLVGVISGISSLTYLRDTPAGVATAAMSVMMSLAYILISIFSGRIVQRKLKDLTRIIVATPAMLEKQGLDRSVWESAGVTELEKGPQ